MPHSWETRRVTAQTRTATFAAIGALGLKSEQPGHLERGGDQQLYLFQNQASRKLCSLLQTLKAVSDIFSDAVLNL
jgi:hypothetical protein